VWKNSCSARQNGQGFHLFVLTNMHIFKMHPYPLNYFSPLPSVGALHLTSFTPSTTKMEKYLTYANNHRFYQSSYNRLRDIIEIFWGQHISITHNSYLSSWCNSSRMHCMKIWIEAVSITVRTLHVSKLLDSILTCINIWYTADIYMLHVYYVNKNIFLVLCDGEYIWSGCAEWKQYIWDAVWRQIYSWLLEKNIFIDAVWWNTYIFDVWRWCVEAKYLKLQKWRNKFEELQRGKHV